jgi:hypothetical protein
MLLKSGLASPAIACVDGARAVLGDGHGHIHWLAVRPAATPDADPDPQRCALAWVFEHPGGRLVEVSSTATTTIDASSPVRTASGDPALCMTSRR